MTGVSQVDNLQDSLHDTAGSTVGKGGILQPVGDMASKEGVNRAERNGKGDDGSYIPSAGGISDGVKGAGSSVAGMFGAGGGNKK